MDTAPDYPVLILLHPDVSQEIFHSRFLVPMGRYETANALGALLKELGWVEQAAKESEDLAEENEISEIPAGVTMVSHSK